MAHKSLISLELVTNMIHQTTTEKIESLHLEKQNSEYEGMTFKIGQFSYRSRLAKKTPNKKGYFVVFWEKDQHHNNTPFKFDDSPDKLIISIKDGLHSGQFIFPKAILVAKGILSYERQLGKMAMRIYPNWVSNLNPTAQRTQLWQLNYFMNYDQNMSINMVRSLYF